MDGIERVTKGSQQGPKWGPKWAQMVVYPVSMRLN